MQLPLLSPATSLSHTHIHTHTHPLACNTSHLPPTLSPQTPFPSLSPAVKEPALRGALVEQALGILSEVCKWGPRALRQRAGAASAASAAAAATAASAAVCPDPLQLLADRLAAVRVSTAGPNPNPSLSSSPGQLPASATSAASAPAPSPRARRPRVFCLSDLHVDKPGGHNLEAIKSISGTAFLNDVLIVAGEGPGFESLNLQKHELEAGCAQLSLPPNQSALIALPPLQAMRETRWQRWDRAEVSFARSIDPINHCFTSDPAPGDAGDTLAAVRLALQILRPKFHRVVFTPGNHDL
jgi:hypothetical protein